MFIKDSSNFPPFSIHHSNYNFDLVGLKAHFVFVHYCMRKMKTGQFCTIKELDFMTQVLGTPLGSGLHFSRYTQICQE
jgi:hypothetical protein